MMVKLIGSFYITVNLHRKNYSKYIVHDIYKASAAFFTTTLLTQLCVMVGILLTLVSLHDDRRRLLDSTYLTRVNVLKFVNLFQSRNKIKLRHLCKLIKIIFSETRPPG